MNKKRYSPKCVRGSLCKKLIRSGRFTDKGELQNKVKQVVANVLKLEADEIADDATFIEAIAESTCTLSQLALDFPELSELDINPLISLEKGAFAADAKIMIKYQERTEDENYHSA